LSINSMISVPIVSSDWACSERNQTISGTHSTASDLDPIGGSIMPTRKKSDKPLARVHKQSGRERVRISGRQFWLGKAGSKIAKENYEIIISVWIANDHSIPDDFQWPPQWLFKWKWKSISQIINLRSLLALWLQSTAIFFFSFYDDWVKAIPIQWLHWIHDDLHISVTICTYSTNLCPRILFIWMVSVVG